jgi:hypothetical protein
VAKETQFCVGLEHRPGMLTNLCKLLRDHGVNIEALFVSNDTEVAWVNFVASPHHVVENALDESEFKYFTEPVITVMAENQPGEIEQIATKLAAADVNINYIYCSGVAGSPSKIVLSADHLEDAERALA